MSNFQINPLKPIDMKFEILTTIVHPKTDSLKHNIYFTTDAEELEHYNKLFKENATIIYFYEEHGDWSSDLEQIKAWAEKDLQLHYNGFHAACRAEGLRIDAQERACGA